MAVATFGATVLGTSSTDAGCRYCAVQQVQQVYTPTYQHYVQPQIAIVAVEDQQYNVQLAGDYVRARNRQSELVDEVRRIGDELASLRQVLAGGQVGLQGGVSSNPPVDVPAQPQQPQEPAQPATPPAAGVDPDLKRAATTLLQQRCASCHSGATSKGQFALFDDDKTTMRPITVGKLILIDQVTYANEMPKAPTPKLTAQEYNLLRAWIQQYSPQIREVARASDEQ